MSAAKKEVLAIAIIVAAITVAALSLRSFGVTVAAVVAAVGVSPSQSHHALDEAT